MKPVRTEHEISYFDFRVLARSTAFSVNLVIFIRPKSNQTSNQRKHSIVPEIECKFKILES